MQLRFIFILFLIFLKIMINHIYERKQFCMNFINKINKQGIFFQKSIG